MPSKAIELASFDLYKKLLGSRRRDAEGRRQHPGGLATTLAGALAGACPAGSLLQDGQPRRLLSCISATCMRCWSFSILHYRPLMQYIASKLEE
jgi:hypothetical protein